MVQSVKDSPLPKRSVNDYARERRSDVSKSAIIRVQLQLSYGAFTRPRGVAWAGPPACDRPVLKADSTLRTSVLYMPAKEPLRPGVGRVRRGRGHRQTH
jgi:hypothetical protein